MRACPFPPQPQPFRKRSRRTIGLRRLSRASVAARWSRRSAAAGPVPGLWRSSVPASLRSLSRVPRDDPPHTRFGRRVEYQHEDHTAWPGRRRAGRTGAIDGEGSARPLPRPRRARLSAPSRTIRRPSRNRHRLCRGLGTGFADAVDDDTGAVHHDAHDNPEHHDPLTRKGSLQERVARANAPGNNPGRSHAGKYWPATCGGSCPSPCRRIPHPCPSPARACP
jgi:hypothetical protein